MFTCHRHSSLQPCENQNQNHHHHGDVTDRLKRRIHALQSYHDTLQEALVSSDRAWSTCTISLDACCEWSPQPKHEERSKKTKRNTHTHSNHHRRGSRESWASQELTIGVKTVTREWQCVTSTTSETSCLILHGILSCARATLPFHLEECQSVSNTYFFPTESTPCWNKPCASIDGLSLC